MRRIESFGNKFRADSSEFKRPMLKEKPLSGFSPRQREQGRRYAMRVLVIAAICSSAVLVGTAYADPAQPQSSAVPSATAPAAMTSAPVATAPAQTPGVAAAPASTMAAASAPAATPNQSGGSVVNLDEVVCRVVAPPTGSRFGGGRECHTVRQWNQRQKDSQDILTREQRMGTAGSPGS
jgi:hypothetical protein